MRKIALSLALGLTSVALPTIAHAQAAAPAQASIIVVDFDRAIGESAAYRGAQAALKPQADALESRANTLSTSLRTEADTLQQAQQANTMAPAAFEARVKEFQGKQDAARTELEGKQRALQLSNAYAIEQINRALDPIIKAVMTERRAQIALASGATVAVGPGVDVTTDVVTRLNTQLPRVGTTPPAGWQPGGAAAGPAAAAPAAAPAAAAPAAPAR